MTQEERELRIGIDNVESLIFEDHKAWKSIPEMSKFRDQWAFSKVSPDLRPTGMAAMIDFLSASGSQQETALSGYFGLPVTIDNADRKCVSNLEFDVRLPPPDLEGMSAYTGFGCFRKGDMVYATFWR